MTIPIRDDGTFDSGVQPLTSSTTFVEIARLPLNGRFRAGLLHVEIGAGGAISSLKLTRGLRDGPELDWITDAGFSTATEECIDVLPATPIQQTPAGGSFQIKLNNLEGTPELALWAKKSTTDTTARLRGQMF